MNVDEMCICCAYMQILKDLTNSANTVCSLKIVFFSQFTATHSLHVEAQLICAQDLIVQSLLLVDHFLCNQQQPTAGEVSLLLCPCNNGCFEGLSCSFRVLGSASSFEGHFRGFSRRFKGLMIPSQNHRCHFKATVRQRFQVAVEKGLLALFKGPSFKALLRFEVAQH